MEEKNNENPQNDFGETKKTNKKGILVPILIVVAIIVVAAVGAFFYFKSQRTADKYLETKLKDVKSSIEESFSSNVISEVSNVNFTEDDSIIDGKIKISSTGETFKDLNSTEMNFNVKTSIGNEYIESIIGVKDANTSIDGAIYIDGNRGYFDFKDVSASPLYVDLQENIFDAVKQGMSNSSAELKPFIDLIESGKLKDISVKTIEYFMEALKETITSTNAKGLNVEYVYTFNKETTNKMLNKFSSLAKNDSSYLDLIKALTGEETIEFGETNADFDETLVVTIEVGLFDNKVKDINIKLDDKVILSKVETDKYKFLYDQSNEKNYAILTLKDNEFGIKLYQDGKELGTFSVVTKKNDTTMNLTVKSIGLNCTLTITEVSKNQTKLSIDANLIILSVKGEVTITGDNQKLKSEGYAELKTLGVFGGQSESLKLEFNSTFESGKNLVTKKTFTNALPAESSADFSKLEEKLTSLGLFNFLENSMGSNDFGYDDGFDIVEDDDFDEDGYDYDFSF